MTVAKHGLLNGGASAAEKPMRTGSVSLPQKWNSLKLMGHRLPPARGGQLRLLDSQNCQRESGHSILCPIVERVHDKYRRQVVHIG